MVRINYLFKSFIDKINKGHLPIKFIAEWSKTSTNFLDAAISLVERVLETDLYVKPTVISIYNPARATLSIAKRVCHIVRL